MQSYFENHEIDAEVINDWFEIIEEAGIENPFIFSVEHYWKTKKQLTINQVRSMRPTAYAAYKITKIEDCWNENWDLL